MSEWKEHKLKDIGCTFLSGYAFKSSDYGNVGIPLIKIGNIQNRNVTIDNTGDFVLENIVNEKVSKYLLLNNDVLIAMTGQGSVGRVGKLKVNEGERALLNQRVGKFLCDEKNININYLYYVLTSDKYQDLLFNTGSGSGQPNLSPELILATEIPWVSYKEQIAIASILTSIDDKIDLLQRQNKTLEQLAETLFKQWFVEEAEEIWETVTLGQFIKTNQKSITKDYLFQEVEYLDTGSLTNGVINETQKLALKDAPSRAKRLVRNNDILISTVRPDQKHYGIINNPNENLVVSTGFCVITCYDINPYFVYLLLTSDEMTQYLHSIAEGSTSTYPSLKPSDIEKIEFQKPPENKLLEFGKLATEYWAKINNNQTQICTLTQTRNTLLPNLMSGEVRVKI